MKLLARVFAAAVTCATVALPLVAADAPSASAIVSSSAARLVAPMTLDGLTALSLEINTKRSTP